MKNIEQIDKEIGKLIKALNKSVDSDLKFETVTEFKLGDFESKLDFKFDLKYSGIYLFEIKTKGSKDFKDWIKEFEIRWNEYKGNTPSIKKKRIKKHIDKVLPKFIPVYVGKSKKIHSRVIEHIFMDFDKTTYALKLKGRKNLYDEMFRLKTIRCEVENYDTILPIIEKNLRDKINPIIGKQ